MSAACYEKGGNLGNLDLLQNQLRKEGQDGSDGSGIKIVVFHSCFHPSCYLGSFFLVWFFFCLVGFLNVSPGFSFWLGGFFFFF